LFGKRTIELTSQDAADPRLGADQGAAVKSVPNKVEEELT
jgi:hypothetical protein